MTKTQSRRQNLRARLAGRRPHGPPPEDKAPPAHATSYPGEARPTVNDALAALMAAALPPFARWEP